MSVTGLAMLLLVASGFIGVDCYLLCRLRRGRGSRGG